MYEYTLDLLKEQQEARKRAIEYIYSQLPEVFDPSNLSIVRQCNGETTSILYKGHLIGMIYEYFDGTTWHIDAKRVPFDKEDEAKTYEHLIDVTCSWDEMDGFISQKYLIGPGYSYEDLTEAEKKIIDLQKEDLK